ncbi:MAG TPA: ATP-dependent zinc metalloprotease FtsH [Steroidobacteraceae bacterium]|nr:ATP-dependent zinc metalloprotease FtsH [Steroidobacteraceae bacterium]
MPERIDTKPPAPRPPTPGTPTRPGIPGWYWIFFALLLLWNFWSFLPRLNEPAKLPYSEFVAQVAADNVEKVHIVGAAISGTFRHAILWPKTPPSPAREPAQPESHPAGAHAASSSHTGAQAPPVSSSASSSAHLAAAAHSAHSSASQITRYTSFSTTYPEVVGDGALMPLLRTHHVTIDVSTPSQPWFLIALTDGMPLVLMVALLVWMGRQASRTQSGIFGLSRNKARRYTQDRPKVTFADVAGADEAKQDLTEVVDFLSHPSKYLQIGAHIPRGVLLVGPPGTGKTLLARAVAGEAGVPFFSISGSEFVEMFVGVGASRVRDLFSQAKEAQPAIIFVDELDAVGRRRGAGLGGGNDEREQTLNQLLVEMDGFDERQQVILLAATNRPDVLDPALLRPGRFDREVFVPLPDWRGRQGILRIHTRHLNVASDVDLEQLARTATGLSGADLANLCNEAALGAARANRTEVTMRDFEEAWDKTVLGAARTTVLTPQDRRVVAYHEGGHAVVAWLTPNADPVRKVTIVPHGRALGVTEQLPTEDRYNLSRADLLARLDVMLGGRTSEALVIGEITTGAENDLIQATRLARRMISRWGMGSLGPVAFDSQEEQPFLGYQISQGRDYSEETGARIDREVQQLLTDRQQTVHRLLSQARERLDALANRLLAEETVGFAELARILGPRPDVSLSAVSAPES